MNKPKFRVNRKGTDYVISDGDSYEFMIMFDGTVVYDGNPDEENEFILMQFTGCKDKNNKEIYEGDIVENWGEGDGMSETMEVFKDETGQYQWGRAGNNLPLYELDPEETLVVGNIYQNPELIK